MLQRYKKPRTFARPGRKVYESVDFAKVGNPGKRAGLNAIILNV
jgi:hypothetical protein